VNDSTVSGPQSAGSNGFVRASFLRMRHRKLKSLLSSRLSLGAGFLGTLRDHVSEKAGRTAQPGTEPRRRLWP
jgi:hypothetical protein